MWILSCSPSPEDFEKCAELLENEALSSSWYESSEGDWRFEAFFEEKPDEDALLGLLPVDHLTLEEAENKDWLRENQKLFDPITIGNFYIYGSHWTEALPYTKKNLMVDAATAFGSGQHETTQGCLLAIEKVLSANNAIKKALDMGCGSAILAMAIGRTKPISIVACDNDPEAVRVAKENITQNALDPFITAFCGNGYLTPALKGPYDLIVANILADPLIEMAPLAVEHMAPGGFLILSGFLTHQAEQVRQAHSQLNLIESIELNEWVTLILQREA